MKKIIDEIGGWPLTRGLDRVSTNWFDLLLKVLKKSVYIDFPFKITTLPNLDNESHVDTVVLTPMNLRINAQHYLNATQSENGSLRFDTYQQELIDLAVLYGADRAQASDEVLEVLEFETALANVRLDFITIKDLFKKFNIYKDFRAIQR